MNSSLITNLILSEKNTTMILIYLFIFGPKSKSEIYKAISTNPRMPLKLELLEKYGLVMKVENDNSNHRVILLTPLGRKYAQTLCQLEKSTGGSVEDFKHDMLKSMIEQRQ